MTVAKCLRCGSKNVRVVFIGYAVIFTEDNGAGTEVPVTRMFCRFCLFDWADTTGQFLSIAEGTA